MALKPAPVTKALNDRQRHYLLAAYQLDQETEQQRRRDFARGLVEDARTPAAEWRAMPYGRWEHRVLEGKPPTPLRRLLDPELVSPGTGSTWKALAERGLLTVVEQAIFLPGMSPRERYALPHVSLTRAGRKLARELLGEVRPPRPRPPKPPEGLLSDPAWRALAAAYAQEPRGLVARPPGTGSFGSTLYGGFALAWLEPLLAPGLLEARPVSSAAPGSYGLSATGRAYYHRYFQVNQAAYPRVAADLPRPPLTPAQVAFWEELAELYHQKSRLIGPTNESRRAVLAITRTILRRKIAADLGTLLVAPYWYPTLAGVGLATSGGRSAVALQLLTEPEAQAEGQRRRQVWRCELALVFDYEELP